VTQVHPSSELDGEPAVEVVLELDQPLHHHEPRDLLFTAEADESMPGCITPSGLSPLDRETSFELEDATHRLEYERVGLAAERLHHADEVAGRGDRGTDAAAEPFAVGAEAEVLVAAGAGGFGDVWGKETRFKCRLGAVFGPLRWAARVEESRSRPRKADPWLQLAHGASSRRL
jgi:hypothetical protein